MNKFKDDFKNDYEKRYENVIAKIYRLRSLSNKRNEKAQEQEEYRKLFDQNAQREIANERAYKKRFEDFEKKASTKTQKYYDICNNADIKRDEAVRKISGGDGTSYYDYYYTREQNKQRKAEELK